MEGERLGTFTSVSTIGEIEAAIAKLPLNEAEEVREWLEQWLEKRHRVEAAAKEEAA